MNKLVAGIVVVASAVLVGRPAAAAPPQDQSFSITFDLALPDQPGVVQATGPISGTGTVSASERDTGNAFHETETWVFAGGTFAVKANDVNTSAVFDQASCTAVFTFKGNFSIKAGTGDFAGVKGHGHFTGTSTIIFRPAPDSPDGCDFDHMSGSIHGEALAKIRLP
jgi:hypothetical protein